MPRAVVALDNLKLPLKRGLFKVGRKARLDTEYSYIILTNGYARDPVVRAFSDNPSLALLVRAKIA